MPFLQTLAQLFADLFATGIGPIARHDNPALYPSILLALGVSIIASLIAVALPTKGSNRVGSALGALVALLIECAGLELLWLAYATPLYRLPYFAPPAAPPRRVAAPTPRAVGTRDPTAAARRGGAAPAGARARAASWRPPR